MLLALLVGHVVCFATSLAMLNSSLVFISQIDQAGERYAFALSSPPRSPALAASCASVSTEFLWCSRKTQ